MANRRVFPSRVSGFSLVELLVAMLFTAILMAGMAKVFQSSLSTFYTAGEKLSSSRRNRLSLDLLYDDLNTAGMLLLPTDISAGGPQSVPVNGSNPLFAINPNVPVTIKKGNANGSDLVITSDQLLMYSDEPLPFEGTLKGAIAGTNSLLATAVKAGTTASMPASTTFTVDCGTSGQASQVVAGMGLVFKDSLAGRGIASVSAGSGNQVVITPSSTIQSAGGGTTGNTLLDPYGHLDGAKVLFLQVGQQIRYSIQQQFLDPNDANHAIPCLVREQENYDPTGFKSPLDPTPGVGVNYSITIVSENVTGLKFYLSMNPGDTSKTPDKIWAGYGYTGTDFNAGILGAGGAAAAGTLNNQLATYGVPGFTSIAPQNSSTAQQDLVWFRNIPAAVRVDLTTRTSTARTEFNQTTSTPTLTFNTHQETLVLVPRHFGLSL
jgi:Tfp pilus assembly protein PilW